MRIVIDTNVIISAMFFGGKPSELLQLAMNRKVETAVSREIVLEYEEIITRMSRKYPNRPRRFPLEHFVSSSAVVSPTRKIDVCRDKDDNKFLECAAEAKCVYVVSGDNDLLSLGSFEDIEILTVAQFFERYENSLQ